MEGPGVLESILARLAAIEVRLDTRESLGRQRPLLTMPQVAAQLGISNDTAYEMGRTRELPVVTIGTNVRVDPADLDRWIEAHKRPHGLHQGSSEPLRSRLPRRIR